MNKYLVVFLCLSLSAFAQTDAEVDASSETVAVPDIIAPEEPEVQTSSIQETTTPDAEIPASPDLSDPKEKEPEVAATTLRPSETPALVTEVEEDDSYKVYKGHWTTLYNFETLKYQTPFKYDNRTAVQKRQKVINQPDAEMFGGRLGFGREFYLGLGFMTTSRIEGYYLGSLFSTTKSADPDAQAVISNSKSFGSIYGFDASQSLGWVFDMKTRNPFMDEMTYLAIEPFVEAGIGLGQAVNKTTFTYDKSNGVDSYRHRVSDKLGNARVGAGINMTSLSGFYFFLRGTINRYQVFSRDQKASATIDGVAVPQNQLTNNDKKIDPIVIYSIGGGYKF